MEMMSKRNYVIGAREPIGGDESPRRFRDKSDEYPLPVVKKDGVGKSAKRERSVVKRKEVIVTGPFWNSRPSRSRRPKLCTLTLGQIDSIGSEALWSHLG